MKIIRCAGLIVAALFAASGVMAQGCAMCYEQASAAGAHAQHSLSIGIIVLLLPALVLFAGVFILLVRRVHAASALNSLPQRGV